MSHSTLYPGFVKLHYNVSGLNHVMVIPVLPYVAVGGDYWLQIKSNTVGEYWKDLVDDFVVVLRPLLSTAVSIISAELWTIASVDADPVFADVHDIDLAGSNVSAFTSMGQLVLTFRTEAGGVLKSYVMEPSYAPNLIYSPPNYSAVTAIKTYADWFSSAGSFAVGRDGSFPVVGIRGRTKTNDALRKKRQLFS